MTVPERVGSKERSPNYPSIGLPTAIEDARALWDREKRTSVPSEVAARAWGYNSLSGPARTTIGALRQYGLIESVDRGVALSDLAVDILVQLEGTQAWVEAINKAADGPDLFRELKQTHSEASDEALRAYLITRKKFSVDGATQCVKSFRETITLANRATQGYAKAEPDSQSAWGHDMTASAVAATQPIGNKDVTVLSFILEAGVRAEVRVAGAPIQPKHIEMLKAYLDVATKALGGTAQS